MSYLFIKKSVSKKEVCIIFIKNLKFKKPRKTTFLMGFFRWVFSGGFFWVGFLLPTLCEGVAGGCYSAKNGGFSGGSTAASGDGRSDVGGPPDGRPGGRVSGAGAAG